MTCTEPLLVNKSVIVSVRNVLIAAGANEFIVCNIEFMSILMNSLIIESTSILNGITEIINKKRCLGGVYAQIITGNFQYKFYDFLKICLLSFS